MLRSFLGLLLLASLLSCSLGVLRSGGERSYVYDVQKEYSIEDLKELSSQVVTTSVREPQKGKLDELFSSEMPPLKRVGILVFETIIQETRSGIAGPHKVFLTATGKQFLTEKLLSGWDQSFAILGKGLEYVPTSKIKRSKAFKADGMDVTDFIKSKRDVLGPDDIFFLESGKKTTLETVLNPRGMRDLSLALVPATELMGGPKFSEHAKHTVNDVAKELKLDALIIVMSKLSWTAGHIDKHSGESIPEETRVALEVTTLVPLGQYHARLRSLGVKRDFPSTTVAYRTYTSELKVPITISVPDYQQTFEYIEKELLSPAMKTYNDLSHMVQLRIVEDLKKTF